MTDKPKMSGPVIAATFAVLGVLSAVTFDRLSKNANHEIIETQPVVSVTATEVESVEPTRSASGTTGTMAVPAQDGGADQASGETGGGTVPRTAVSRGLLGRTQAPASKPQALMIVPPGGERTNFHTPHTSLRCTDPELVEWAKTFEVWEIWCAGANGTEQRILGNWPKPPNWPWPVPDDTTLLRSSDNVVELRFGGTMTANTVSAEMKGVSDGLGSSQQNGGVGESPAGLPKEEANGVDTPVRAGSTSLASARGNQTASGRSQTLRCQVTPLESLSATCGWWRDDGKFRFYDGVKLTDVTLLGCDDPRIRRFAGESYNYWESTGSGWVNKGQRNGLPNLACDASLQLPDGKGGWAVVPQIEWFNANEAEMTPLRIAARHDYISRTTEVGK